MQSKAYLSSSSYKKEKNILFYAYILLRISILISIIFIELEFNLKSFPCHQQIEIQIIIRGKIMCPFGKFWHLNILHDFYIEKIQ